jgi:hypothetical protein
LHALIFRSKDISQKLFGAQNIFNLILLNVERTFKEIMPGIEAVSWIIHIRSSKQMQVIQTLIRQLDAPPFANHNLYVLGIEKDL